VISQIRASLERKDFEEKDVAWPRPFHRRTSHVHPVLLLVEVHAGSSELARVPLRQGREGGVTIASLPK
jgi:hypothetical protein